ncbi:cellulosome protein [Sphingomonas yunnanensis]|uniref:cellulosome protein n=1 Tax=Sphingomonas yunnanensis TaxID=310400 RepID=UPI001CA6B64D|nr:cellulosome protein [Sphingomonas yunnanensis]MBY9064912.1 cellulosome protein [Sphingomonas yunnanensis]
MRALVVAGLLATTATPALAQDASERMTVDMGSDTGAFHGGASGTLYGLYDARLPHPNLLEGINLRTVSTKAQDGPQHPGADALEVATLLTDASGGDTYIYMTDIFREFPYKWKSGDCAQSVTNYIEVLRRQAAQVGALPERYRNRIVFVPFNEPDGNMFSADAKSCTGVSWLKEPAVFLDAWDRAVRALRQAAPRTRIAGPNTSILFDQVEGFLQHAIASDTMPDVVTWHELSDPATVRTSVRKYRAWEDRLFAGTKWQGRHLPVNINEYAYNYHTSVPGQMIQWVAAIEDAKVDADIAYWNIDGNLSDSAVQANRGNGQWWLLNAYATMTGHTLAVTPPHRDQSYTLQGVATLDPARRQARVLLGGKSGAATVMLTRLPALFGAAAQVRVREIAWTGQLGDATPPVTIVDRRMPVLDGAIALTFGKGDLPALREESAYELVVTPATTALPAPPAPWRTDYEAEAATRRGSGLKVRGPEGSPKEVSRFHTSGGYSVEGFAGGNDAALDFAVQVPRAGRYALRVLASTFNKDPLAEAQGATNVFLRVDGNEVGEIYLPLGYKPAVLDHADTTLTLSAGRHVVTLATRSRDGRGRTQGNALVDRITLTQTAKDAAQVYDARDAKRVGRAATWWVYAAKDGPARLDVSGGRALRVNGRSVRGDTAFLLGGVNKVEVADGTSLRVTPLETVGAQSYEAEGAQVAGTARIAAASLAIGGKAVFDIGGAPGNVNTLTFPDIRVARAGTYALTVRFSNDEQSKATHYNPDPLARVARISVNGAAPMLATFPNSFHRNNWWEMTIPVELRAGRNTVRIAGEEQPNWDGKTYASQDWPDVLLRSRMAPNIDRIIVTPMP